MVKKKTWSEFRSTGLLLIVNQLLHIFGWAIVVETDQDATVVNCYPARVKFRGFDNKTVSENYEQVAKYLMENAQELHQEAQEGK